MVLVATLIPLILYGLLILQRPPRSPLTAALFAGVTYTRQVRSTPRPIMIHGVRIDLTTPGIKVIVSPGVDASNADASNADAPADASNADIPNADIPEAAPSGETIAQTTAAFLAASRVQIAVNGSFFYPFREKSPWDYYPHSGESVYALGEAIAAGVPYAPSRNFWHPLCVLPHQVLISTQTTCPPETEFALAGGPLLLHQGHSVPPARPTRNADKPYPRMIVATNTDGTQLWLVAIDGKQPFYSAGMTLPEATELVQSLGASDALALDGGGSTTLVQATANGPRVLNAPIHTKLPMRKRPVANHLGIYARSQPSS